MKKSLKKLVCALFAGIMVCTCGCGSKVDGLFQDLEWGTSYEETEAAVTEKTGTAPEENADCSRLNLTEENYLGVEGVQGRVEYSFQEKLLNEVFVYLEFDENAFTNDEIMNRYTEILGESFGKPSKETKEEKIWKLGKSEVHLANFSYGVLVLDYKPKN